MKDSKTHLLMASFALALAISPVSFSAEVDSFTKRDQVLTDSLSLLNKKANQYLERAINDANEKSPCEEKDLYKAMRKYFNNQYQGEFSEYIVHTEDFDKSIVSIEEGIYQDFNWKQSFVQGFWGRYVIEDPTSPNMLVNGVLIGTDKFEHFFGSGFRYYKKNYIKRDGVRAAMRIGEKAETGVLGAITTGVMAYGDLSANFNGMRFWNHVLQKYDDVLGSEYNIGPYVSCEDGKWKLAKEMNFADYIDQSFDEGSNCSFFPNKEMLGKVLHRIEEAEERTGMKLTCPIESQKIKALLPKYGVYAEALINADGHGALKEED